ncbi:MAG: hypothetical protein FWG40_02470 [Peptococcaceae bacterium]|nr:hypothetical protein [Peptococcaceae bacterium]
MAKNQRNPMKTFILVSGVALAVFIHFFSWYSLCYDIGRTAYGCLPISAKTIDNNNCYFIVDNVLQLGDARKVQCSKDVYDALIIDEDVRYYMSFRTLSLTPDNGYLEMIDTKNYIDNRTHPTVED